MQEILIQKNKGMLEWLLSAASNKGLFLSKGKIQEGNIVCLCAFVRIISRSNNYATIDADMVNLQTFYIESVKTRERINYQGYLLHRFATSIYI